MAGHVTKSARKMTAHERPRMRRWMLLSGGIALLAGHSVILYYVQSHVALSAAVLSGVVVLIVIKHVGVLAPLYAAVRRRSFSTPPEPGDGQE
jgi:uncharacterized membrane protein HdeD (DUF308 family)